ncbi:cysteine dioxygenase family protein [Cupriavidus sp. WKF15]|uniref:cysteine dioxygenase family protein n=1 Tax=Cupriavidus sp. WKF15 TaxID=3032282 RepID=UPI0023E34D42|nr:cysteine dioxygenase family protein [Cupriavidus sp. WKF15]WER48355.1 cysteine dioxygenase family protein [Cupriavidus sp. WKF15]
MSHSSPADRQAARRKAVAAALTDIRRLAAGQPDRAALDAIAARLQALAGQRELFTREDFPPPVDTASGASTRYRLNPDDGDDAAALYLNSINPGKTTIPHNHDTWAVIVAVEGREFNRVYRRTDDRSDPTVAQLEIERELTVEPGTPIAFLPDDIHSIHVIGDAPTLHFHCYGRPLETLTGRYGVRPETGEIVNYNATQMQPSKVAA